MYRVLSCLAVSDSNREEETQTKEVKPSAAYCDHTGSAVYSMHRCNPEVPTIYLLSHFYLRLLAAIHIVWLMHQITKEDMSIHLKASKSNVISL